VIRLGVNIDHIATLRNARGGNFPCPINGAIIAKDAGANGITAHLREDRRHIKDADIYRIKDEVGLPLNFEMAATSEMLAIALKVRPNAVCLVPEKRQELTTEGGLDLENNFEHLKDFTAKLKNVGIRVSLFINPDISDCELSNKIGADIVELHTGTYCHNICDSEYNRLYASAIAANNFGIEVHAGHGLDYATAKTMCEIPHVAELNIGHFLISDSIYVGLDAAVKKMLGVMRG
jgi:pyridoxine 5-phosphate synthase